MGRLVRSIILGALGGCGPKPAEPALEDSTPGATTDASDGTGMETAAIMPNLPAPDPVAHCTAARGGA